MKPPPPVIPSAMGSSAKIVASAVIRIGRSRRLPPSTTASCSGMPCSRYWLIRSSRTMALVTTMPTSISMPIIAARPSEVPVASSRPMAPVAANGIDTSSTSGWIRLRNVATMTKNTRAMAATSASPRLPKASAWSALTPPISYVAPAGSVRDASLVFSAALVAPRLEPVALPETVALRSPSMRVTSTGPFTVLTLATSPTVTFPAIFRSRRSASDVGVSPLRRMTLAVVPSKAIWVTVVPLNAWDTAWPMASSLRPFSAAFLRSTVTSMRGAVSATVLVTSLTSGTSAMARWTVCAAVRRVPSSAARTTTCMESPPKPPDCPTVISPASLSPASRSVSLFSTAPASVPSRSVREKLARDVPPPPPRKPPNPPPPPPTVTWYDSTSLVLVTTCSTFLAMASAEASEVLTGKLCLTLMVFWPELSMKLVRSSGTRPRVPTKMTMAMATVVIRCRVAKRMTGTYMRWSGLLRSFSSAARRIASESPSLGRLRNQ